MYCDFCDICVLINDTVQWSAKWLLLIHNALLYAAQSLAALEQVRLTEIDLSLYFLPKLRLHGTRQAARLRHDSRAAKIEI